MKRLLVLAVTVGLLGLAAPLTVLIDQAPPAESLPRSQRVGFVPDSRGCGLEGGCNGGEAPVADHQASEFDPGEWTGWKDPDFTIQATNIAAATISDSAVPDPLANVDTLVLFQLCSIGTFLDDDDFNGRVRDFVQNGGKLIVWDSECSGFQRPDYSKFIYTFESDNPNPTGASGTLILVENSTLGSNDPNSPYYVNGKTIGEQTDGVGDANVFTTFQGDWCTSKRVINVNNVNGPTQTYATFGAGLIIYNGLDSDTLANGQKIDNPPTDPADPDADGNEGRENLGYTWELMLKQPWDPVAGSLPCRQSASGITLSPSTATNLPGTEHTLTASLVDITGNAVPDTDVTLTITAGPNSPQNFKAKSGADGRIDFTYTGDIDETGTDILEASARFPDESQVRTSNSVRKIWSIGQPPTCPGLVWYFAEGTTRADFDEFILLFNTGDVDANANVTYFFADGSPQQTKSVLVPANGRHTIQTWVDVGRDKDISVQVTADQNLVTERSIYANHDFGFGVVNASHSVVGTSEPRTQWSFAEGTTLPGFQEYLTILNPGSTESLVKLNFGIEGEAPIVRDVTVPAGRRITVDVNDPGIVGPGKTGVSVQATSNEPVLIERPLYFLSSAGFDTGIVNGATVSYGVLAQRDWFFAEGTVLPRFRMFLTLANPDPVNDITADIEYLLENNPSITKSTLVPAGSRKTVQVFSESDPAGIGQNVSDPVSRGVSVHVTTTALRGMFAERPVYLLDHEFDPSLPPISDGTDKPGVAEPITEWNFAEGTTRANFRTFYTIQNPQTETVTAHVTYFIAGQSPAVKTIDLPAQSRTTIQVYNASQPGALGTAEQDFATLVTGGRPIIVERPFYVNHVFPDIPTAINGGSVVFGLPNNCD